MTITLRDRLILNLLNYKEQKKFTAINKPYPSSFSSSYFYCAYIPPSRSLTRVGFFVRGSSRSREGPLKSPFYKGGFRGILSKEKKIPPIPPLQKGGIKTYPYKPPGPPFFPFVFGQEKKGLKV
jgi:hypothetical protein